jgi:hypothetical protein
VAEPPLNLGDIGLVVERVGRGRRTRRVGPDLKTELRGIPPHQPVDHVGIDRLVEPAGAVVPDRPKESAIFVRAVAGGLEVIVDQFIGAGIAAADSAFSRLCRGR